MRPRSIKDLQAHLKKSFAQSYPQASFLKQAF